MMKAPQISIDEHNLTLNAITKDGINSDGSGAKFKCKYGAKQGQWPIVLVGNGGEETITIHLMSNQGGTTDIGVVYSQVDGFHKWKQLAVAYDLVEVMANKLIKQMYAAKPLSWAEWASSRSVLATGLTDTEVDRELDQLHEKYNEYVKEFKG